MIEVSVGDLVMVKPLPHHLKSFTDLQVFENQICEVIKVTESNFPEYPWYTVCNIKSPTGTQTEFFLRDLEPVSTT